MKILYKIFEKRNKFKKRKKYSKKKFKKKKMDDENEIKEQNEAFKIFDFNHDGNLNKEEANWAFYGFRIHIFIRRIK